MRDLLAHIFSALAAWLRTPRPTRRRMLDIRISYRDELPDDETPPQLPPGP